MSIQNTLSGFNTGGTNVAITGAVHTAPVGTAVVDIDDDYDKPATHRTLGYISPDGVDISFDEDKQEYIPWQAASPIRVDITKAVTSVKITLWETGPGQLANFLGVPQADIEDLAGGGQAFWQGSLPEFEHVQLSVDMIDGAKQKRVTFLDAQISERGSLVLKKDEIFGLELTYTTFPAGSQYATSEPKAVGNTARWQFNKDWKNASDITSSEDGVEALAVTTSTLDEGKVGAKYSATVAATGGTAPYIWSIASGELPKGLTLAATGAISGTPTVAGASNVTVRADDDKGLFASKALKITVTA